MGKNVTKTKIWEQIKHDSAWNDDDIPQVAPATRVQKKLRKEKLEEEKNPTKQSPEEWTIDLDDIFEVWDETVPQDKPLTRVEKKIRRKEYEERREQAQKKKKDE